MNSAAAASTTTAEPASRPAAATLPTNGAVPTPVPAPAAAAAVRPVASRINTAAIPDSKTSKVRPAILHFMSQNIFYIPQDMIEALFEKAGYDRATVRQALYDMTSTKLGQLERSEHGLKINPDGLSTLEAS